MPHFEQRKQGSYHDGEALIVDAKIVDWWLEEMGILFEPGKVCGMSVRLHLLSSLRGSGETYHLGRFTGVESILRAVQKWTVRKRLVPTIKVWKWKYE
jgi:hypothetical protein